MTTGTLTRPAGGVMAAALGPWAPGGGYSTGKAAALAGVSYRQLDYWARNHVLEPTLAGARGSGTHRRYSERDVMAAAALGRLARLGAEAPALRALAAAIAVVDLDRLPAVAYVAAAGAVSLDPGLVETAGAAWAVVVDRTW